MVELAVLRRPDPAAGGLLGCSGGPRENRHDEGSVVMQFRGPWRLFGMPDGSFSGTLAAILGHTEAVRAPPLHEKMHAPVCLASKLSSARGRKCCQIRHALLQRQLDCSRSRSLG